MNRPKKLADCCEVMEATLSVLVRQYEPMELLELSIEEALLAASIVAHVRSSWMWSSDSFRVNSKNAKSLKTTTAKLHRCFPAAWYQNDPTPLPEEKHDSGYGYIVVFPSDFLSALDDAFNAKRSPAGWESVEA